MIEKPRKRIGIVSLLLLSFAWILWPTLSTFAQTAQPKRLTLNWTLTKTGKPLEREALITLTDAQDQPVSGASIELNVDMPSMPMMHAVPKTIAQPTGEPGRYKARFTLEMAGEWAAQIEIRNPGRTKVVKKFTVD